MVQLLTFRVLATLKRNAQLGHILGKPYLPGHSRRNLATLGDSRLRRILEIAALENEDSGVRRQCRELLNNWKQYQKEFQELEGMKDDPDLKDLALIDAEQIQIKVEDLQKKVLDILIPEDVAETSDTIIEVNAGVGGQEAMLFASELFEMYSGYAQSKGWDFEMTAFDTTEIGGVRKASASITGTNVYKYLRYEGGIHRVQRVPKTESKGRIHTSTAGVIILPQPSELVVEINPKDLKIETKRASGAGGQHVNTTDSAVRIVHLPTGIAVESQAQRSQLRNKETAMNTLRAKLYQLQLDKQLEKTSTARKLQVSSNSRSDKIRTYNFIQDRVTDHRIGLSVRNLPEFLQGGYPLNEMIETLVEEGRKELVNELYTKAGL